MKCLPFTSIREWCYIADKVTTTHFHLLRPPKIQLCVKVRPRGPDENELKKKKKKRIEE
jgi:hypothetical protein